MATRSRLKSGRKRKSRLVFGTVLAVCVLLLGRHFFSGKIFSTSETQHAPGYDNDVSLSLLDERGTIYDRNYKELAVTLDRVSVYANVRDVNMDDVAEKLSPILKKDPDVLKNAIRKEPYRAWLAKNISKDKETAIAALHLSGIYLHREKVRYYPQGQTASHLVGYVGKSMGLSGVEFSYNSLLNKYSSMTLEQENAAASESGKVEGKALFLSVDLNIQKILESIVADLAAQEKGGHYAALLVDLHSGSIIGSGHYPAFDPNRTNDRDPAVTRNILVSPVAIPERVRKLFRDISLLQYMDEKGNSGLPWSLYAENRGLGSQLRLWDRLGLNAPQQLDWIKQDGSMSGKKELRHNLDKNDGYDSIPEVTTPMHLVHAFDGLLTGKNVPLHVIEKITDQQGREFQVKHEMGKEDVVDVPVKDEITALLKAETTPGPQSSMTFDADALSYATVGSFRSYEHNRMSFTFIPAEKPKLMLFVLANLPVYFPSPAGTKSTFDIAGAVTGKITPMILKQEVYPTLADVLTVAERENENFDGSKLADTAQMKNDQVSDVASVMPKVVGKSLRRSLQELSPFKLDIKIIGTGVVNEQYPQEGAKIHQGDVCRLLLQIR